MMLVFISLLSMGIAVIISSCEDDIGPIIIKPTTSDPISYSTEIQPIFDASCIGCHDQMHQSLDLRSCCSYNQLWTSGGGAPYINTDNPTQSKLYKHLTGELLLMPVFGPLPDYEIDVVLKWIEEGAIDN